MRLDFLFASIDAGGTVPPLAGAVRRLAARGHRVRVLGDAVMRAEIEAAGGTLIPWWRAGSRADRSAESDPIRDWEETAPGGGLLRLLDRMTIGPAAAHAADTLAELRRAPADVVVSSDLIFGPMLAAEAAGTKLAVLSCNVSLFPLPGIPPMGPGLAPAATAAERELAAAVGGWFAGALAERLPVLNAARAGLGLPPLADTLAQPGSALHLLATSRAFDFPSSALPPHVRYVGPLLDPPGWVGEWRSPWAADDARPLVLVAMSTSFQDQLGTIRRVAAAAAGLGARVLVTLGPALAGTAGLEGLGEAVHVVDSAPHDAVMPLADAVVTHCGHGTVLRALAHGRPMLCLPMGRDQNDNAARVAARGAGLRLAPEADIALLRAALSALLRDPRHRAAAASLGAAIARAEPADALVKALEELACSRPCRQAA